MNDIGYFSKAEMACKCGCGIVKTQPRFIFKMNLLREYVGHPLRINSWCRCHVHNISVGGTPDSSHPKGWASDINATSLYVQCRILFAAGQLGFRGVGIAKHFIHLDDDPNKPSNRFWIY